MIELISIREAAKRSIERLRKPVWVSKFDHAKIDIIDGEPGPWVHCYFPMNVILGGNDPVDVLAVEFDYDEKCYVPHTGPAHDSEEYKAEIEIWKEVKRARKWARGQS